MCRPTKRPKPSSQFEPSVVSIIGGAPHFDLKRPEFEIKAPQVEAIATKVSAPAPSSKQTFVYTTYEMVCDEANAVAIGFDSTGTLVQIRDATVFGEEVLPKYFRHRNVTSFYRQLNSYGFRTIKTSSVEVSHTFVCDLFRQDRPDLLPLIVRKKAAPPPPALAAAQQKAQQKIAAAAAVVSIPQHYYLPPAPSKMVQIPHPHVSSTQSSVMKMIQELQEFQRSQQLRAEQLEANIRRLSCENSQILKEGESVVSNMQDMVKNQTDVIEKLFGSKASEAFVSQLNGNVQAVAPAAPATPDFDMMLASPEETKAVLPVSVEKQPESKMMLPDDDLLELETLLAFEDDGFLF